MKNILRVIPTIDVINVLETYSSISTSEMAGIMLELLRRELWIKDDTVEILEDFWREKIDESVD